MLEKREIIVIDEEKCDGCGLCIPSCPEGALKIVDTPAGPKARLVKQSFCDGLGACLGDCPRGALRIETREAAPYDEEGVIGEIKENSPELLGKHLAHMKEHAGEQKPDPSAGLHSCPSATMRHWGSRGRRGEPESPDLVSELRQWPVQLHLVSPGAPYFEDADLVLVADCVPFAYPDFHRDFLKGNAVAVACPKLDRIGPYKKKICDIVVTGNVRSVTVVHMEVPCCSGLIEICREALAESGRELSFETVVVGIRGGTTST